MGLSNLINETTKYEQLMNEKIQQIIEMLADDLAHTHLDGVTQISSSPKCITVNLSTVRDNKFNLSPQYYISELQTEEIISRIKNKSTLTEIHDFLNETYTKGYIKKGTDKIIINTAVKEKLNEILQSFYTEDKI